MYTPKREKLETREQSDNDIEDCELRWTWKRLGPEINQQERVDASELSDHRHSIPEVTQHFASTVSDTQRALPIHHSPVSPNPHLPCPVHPYHFTPFRKKPGCLGEWCQLLAGTENYLFNTLFSPFSWKTWLFTSSSNIPSVS